MSLRRVFVAGGASTPFIGRGSPDFIGPKHPQFGKRSNPTIEQHLLQAVHSAFETSRVVPESVQRGYVGNFIGELFSKQGHLGAALAGSHPSLLNKPMMRVEGACASGGLAFSCAVDAIRAGADVVLVAGVEVQTTADSRTGADFLARASHYATQRPIHDFVFPALFARRSAAYKRKHGATEEDIGRAAVKAYANAARNPLAHMRSKSMLLTTAASPSEGNPLFLHDFEDVGHMKLSDCSQMSDGGSALLLCSEAGLRISSLCPSDVVELLSSSTCTTSLYSAPEDLTFLSTCASAANSAYTEAKVRASDIDVAEVHDCFTITELLMYEALQLCSPGSASAMLRAHETDISGRIPVNTGGGLVGFGHPVGATGVKQVVEIWRQMKGKCGAYQLQKIPHIGVCANMGGDDRTAVVSVLRNCL